MSSGSQLADKGLVQNLAEIRWVVIGVSYSNRDSNITAKGGLAAVRRPDDEVVALDELVVQQTCGVYQSVVTVDAEVVGAVVDVR